MLTLRVSTLIYTDPDLRNWLSVRNCRIIPTKLGEVEIEFLSEQTMIEFGLRWGNYSNKANLSEKNK